MVKEVDATGTGYVDIQDFADWLYGRQKSPKSPKKATPKQAKSKAARDIQFTKEMEAAVAKANAELEEKLRQVTSERDAALASSMGSNKMQLTGDLTVEQEAAMAKAKAEAEKEKKEVEKR